MENDILVSKVSGKKTVAELSISKAGRNIHIPNGLNYGPFMSDSYIIEYCAKGSLTVFTEGKEHKISAGNLYVISPNQILEKHYTAPSTATTYITVNGTIPKKYFKKLGFTPKAIVFPHNASYKCVQQLEAIVDSQKICTRLVVSSPDEKLNPEFITNEKHTNHSDPEAMLHDISLFTVFLAELFRSCGDKKEPENHQPHLQYVNEAINFIEANYSYDISVDDVARHIGITRNYLFMLFKSHLDISPQNFILQTRMNAACEFLKQPDVAIKVVATSVGYEPLSFSRVFKKHTGMSPSEYQKKTSCNN